MSITARHALPADIPAIVRFNAAMALETENKPLDSAALARGVYTLLHRFIEASARDHAGARGIRLYVDRDTARAQRVYEAMGMTRARYDMFEREW